MTNTSDAKSSDNPRSIRFPSDVSELITRERERRSAEEGHLINTTDVVVDAVRDALGGGTGRIPIAISLVDGLRVAAKACSNISLSDFLQQALHQFVEKPHSPWAVRPGQIVKAASDARSTQEEYLRAMVRELEVGAAVSTIETERDAEAKAQPDDPRAVVSMSIPRGVRTKETLRDLHQSQMEISGHLRSALRHESVRVRILFIDKAEEEKNQLTEFHRQDEQFLNTVIGKMGNAEERLEFQRLTISDVIGGFGMRSDREYLNQFEIYGTFGVGFTFETCLGMPLRRIFSRVIDDVAYWNNIFDKIWCLHPDRIQTPAKRSTITG